MYYSIRGRLIVKEPDMTVIETGGVGYEIHVPRSVIDKLPEIAEEALLFTLLIVRENEQYLVGFSSLEEKTLYQSLLSVSGIGPKQGLKILSDLTPMEIRSAIINGDSHTLSRVKGLGPKTASRLILELKDKISRMSADTTGPVSGVSKVRLEALMALRVLGYTDNEAKKALDKASVADENADNENTEGLIKKALSFLSRGEV